MVRHQLTVFWILCFAWTSCASSIVTTTADGNSENPPGKYNYSVYLGEVVVAADANDGQSTQNAQEKLNTLQIGAEQKQDDNYGDNNSLRNLVKRAPSGFMGMRGKKANDFGDYSTDDQQLADDSQYTQDFFGRRFKKTPSGIYGVRDKNYNSPNGIKYNRYTDLWKRLEEQHVRDLLVQEFIDRLAWGASEKQNEGIEKRAPTGFTGMRGKRLYGEAEDFKGILKRGPSNAFVGVRGKKDQNYKRSPGEKPRGKNSRFVDFSNKFVAVRGKKSENSLYNDASDDDSAYTYEDDDSENSASSTEEVPIKMTNLRERYYVNMFPSLVPYISAEKRTPSGFLGMRGKRSTDTEGLLPELQ